jgi:hypothetical protein
MADWDEPTIDTLYTQILDDLKARDVDAAQMFSQGSTNIPDKAIGYSVGENRLVIYNEGTSTWYDLLGVLASEYGGTGRSLVGKGSLLVGGGLGEAMGSVDGAEGYILVSTGFSSDPEYKKAPYRQIMVSPSGGVVGVAPTGWTAQKTATGNYTITTGSDNINGIPIATGTNSPIVSVGVTRSGTNTIYVSIKYNAVDTLVDAQFSLICNIPY